MWSADFFGALRSVWNLIRARTARYRPNQCHAPDTWQRDAAQHIERVGMWYCTAMLVSLALGLVAIAIGGGS